MNAIKRISGLVWIALSVAALYMMLRQMGFEITKATLENKNVLDTKMFWYVIIPIFTPIMLGLFLFGWYAWKGEYDRVEQ
jgi:hypothetical protein